MSPIVVPGVPFALPRQIVMLRHGESAANVDPSIYASVPDYRIPLTPLGVDQARRRGQQLREQFAGEAVRVYLSPYLRSYQTLDALGIDDLVDRVVEEPRLREQDWANYQDPESIRQQVTLRNHYGHFFYRFSDGESGADVYDRVSSLLSTLFRHFSKPAYPPNVLLITHGLTMRLLCMRWFHWSVDYFESLDNPGNGETRSLVLEPSEAGAFRLDRPFAQWRASAPPTGGAHPDQV